MGVFSLQSLPKTLQKTTQGTGEISQATLMGFAWRTKGG
jgi:hypothetical protein